MDKRNFFEHFKSYKWGSVYVKYLGQLVVILSVPFIIFVICMFLVVENGSEAEIANSNTLSLLRVSNSIDMSIENIYHQTNWLAADSNVLYFFSGGGEEYYDYDPTKVKNMLSVINGTSSSFINSVHLYSLAEDSVIALKGGGRLAEFYDNSWYSEYEKNRDKALWFQTREIIDEGNVRKKVITIFNAIKIMGNHSGVIIVNLEINELSEFMEIKNTNEISFYDSEGNLLYPHSGEALPYSEIEKMDLSVPYSVITNENNLKKVSTYIKSDRTGWTYVSTLKLATYSQQITNMRSFLIIAVILSVFICICLGVYVFYIMVKPVNKILLAIDDDNEISKGFNEIDFIINTISKTQKDKKRQEIELKNRVELLKKAQITAMQAQISPHFLVNILNTIRFMSMKLTGGNNDVSNAVTSLLELYRISISDSEHFTTVRAEIEHITRYVELQKIRFKDKFDVEFSIEPEIMDMSAMKIMLQPIVENAINHGIKPKAGKGIIKTKAYAGDNKLIFEISDNGVGMSEETINDLNQYITSDYFENFDHLGVKNVNQRLKLIFGDEFGVTIRSKKGIGTKITLSMPKIQSKS